MVKRLNYGLYYIVQNVLWLNNDNIHVKYVCILSWRICLCNEADKSLHKWYQYYDGPFLSYFDTVI